ncbi:MAG: acyl-CoA mutase large subunit family protein [Desulfobacterota bacterium]|nr:acyl-CoA mutase large subunit family protein [Thermodesulfobacteriota bacterium]MDW8002584.1 methylmalonyl-CoA mutase family protein [Deltaproteobacteria bacterium]
MPDKFVTTYDHTVGERLPHFRSLSGIEYKRIYDEKCWNKKLPDAGEYPFTRGIYKDMYRSRLWTRRQQSGFGTPEESNELLKFLFKMGQTGINIDSDIASKLGLDPDYPLAQADVGLQGTSMCTYEDMTVLFKDIPIDRISTTLIFPPPSSAVMMAQYLLMAEERGIPAYQLQGTIMNCPFTQLVGPTYQANTAFFPIDVALEIGLDLVEYLLKVAPRWNVLNVNSRNIRECGVDAVWEAAFGISLGMDYVRRLIRRGLHVDSFAQRIGFFCAVHMDLFEEVAKFRAMRRIWARVMKEIFGAKSEKSMQFRCAVQTSSLTFTAQEPLNNIVRASIQTLAAILSGVQSIHTTCYDEAYCLPTEKAQKLALRTQEILAYETGCAKVVDPLGGSYFLEALTDELEEKIWELVKDIEKRGGFIECFKSGFVENVLNEARYRFAEQIESGELPIVGLNIFRDEEANTDIEIFTQRPDMQRQRIEYAINYKNKKGRDSAFRALKDLYLATKRVPRENLVLPIMEATRQRATLQEICDAMRDALGFEIPH